MILELSIVLILLLLSSILPIPEESVLLLGAYFAAMGVSTLQLVLLAVLAIAAADTIAYARGAGKARMFQAFKRGRKFIAHTGFFAVFMSRFFISARVVMPYMAGAMRMPRSSFHIASVLSALLSSLVIIVGGAWIVRMLQSVTSHASTLWLAFLLVVTVLLVSVLAKHRGLLDGTKLS